jgi:ATP-dependent RNA helicase SUPV3L1/SUV3
MKRDESLSGRAKGFAFRLVEGFGILPRGGEVAEEVRALDQDARGALRKHGVRFGQFTIFLPALLKPAPTRLRLVLWSLANGLDTFPEAPPPGLVTIPADGSAPRGYAAMAGYRAAGARAIRIDMLERLADMLRAEDTKGGFEARADMLSITGLTLEQFADLMQGLGYRAVRGERPKARPAPAAPEEVQPVTEAAPAADDVPPDAAPTAADAAPEVAPSAPQQPGQPVAEAPQAGTPAEVVSDASAPEQAEPAPDAGQGETNDQPPERAPGEAGPEAQVAPAPDPEETEVFYTFTWAGRGRGQARGRPRREQGETRPRGDAPKARGKGKPKGGKPQRDAKPKTFTAGPDRKAKDRIDPDNPFAAALMGLKDKE